MGYKGYKQFDTTEQLNMRAWGARPGRDKQSKADLRQGPVSASVDTHSNYL